MMPPQPPPGYPAPPPYSPAPPPPPRRRRSRAGGIILAVGGLATLGCVFVLPWAASDIFNQTLWEYRANAARFVSGGRSLSYQVPFYTALVAGVLALLAGLLAAAVGNRAANVVAALVGFLASVLAVATPVYHFFRTIEDLGSVESFMEVTGAGFYVMYVISVLLLAGAIVAVVGVVRTGKPRSPAAPPRPAPPAGPPPAAPPPGGYPRPSP